MGLPNILRNRIINRQQQETISPAELTPEDFYNGARYDIEPDNSRWELDYNDVLKEIESSLRGKIRKEDGTFILPKDAKPKLNDAGVSDFISDLKNIMHKGTALGSISENYAKDLTKAMGKAFARKLVYNTKAWDVNKNQRRLLVLQFSTQVYLILTRPIGDKERVHRRNRFSIDEQYKHNEISPDEIRM
jgi:hypothetical protein